MSFRPPYTVDAKLVLCEHGEDEILRVQLLLVGIDLPESNFMMRGEVVVINDPLMVNWK